MGGEVSDWEYDNAAVCNLSLDSSPLTYLQTIVGLVGPTSALIGADAAVHLAEEIKDAAYVLPRAMVSSALINYVAILTMVISFCSAIEPDQLTTYLESSTGR